VHVSFSGKHVYTREGENHTLDEELGGGASSVTVTVGCSDEAGTVLCIVMTVNAGGTEDEAST
jgi:hypothetical protein